VIRFFYLCAYAGLAALGAGLVGPPAILWIGSQGLLGTARAWDVPFGALLLASAALLAVLTVWLASQVALRRKPGAPLHAAFLLSVGICFALRRAAGDPRPPPDATPTLLDGLRIAADALDRGYAGQYAPDAAEFASPLAGAPPAPFRRLGRLVPLHARILSGADGPQLLPLEGDQPGTVYVAISTDRQRAWLTAVAPEGILRDAGGNAAVIAARAGTHSPPGGDEALPIYPGSTRVPVR
jgi:hypothetical protein